MKRLQRLELIKDFVQEAVDKGATSVEQIHRYVADLPFAALEESGLLENERANLRARQQRSIGMVYDAIRRINRDIGELISDQFANLEDAQEVVATLEPSAEATHRRSRRKPASKAKSKTQTSDTKAGKAGASNSRKSARTGRGTATRRSTRTSAKATPKSGRTAGRAAGRTAGARKKPAR
jgi:polyhydroxyalkanoate synthesis regulator phasin